MAPISKPAASRGREVKPIKEWLDLYPSTQPYVIGAVIIAALGGLIGVRTALILLAVAAVFAVILAERVEVRQIHRMIDGQHTALVARIDHLTELLAQHGISAPQESDKVHEARAEKEFS